MKRGQLPQQGSLHRTALYGVEVGHVALMDAQDGVKGSQEGHRISNLPRDQVGLERGVPGAITSLRVHRYTPSDIQYRNYLHRARHFTGRK
jgi:hypothetical protein